MDNSPPTSVVQGFCTQCIPQSHRCPDGAAPATSNIKRSILQRRPSCGCFEGRLWGAPCRSLGHPTLLTLAVSTTQPSRSETMLALLARCASHLRLQIATGRNSRVSSRPTPLARTINPLAPEAARPSAEAGVTLCPCRRGGPGGRRSGHPGRGRRKGSAHEARGEGGVGKDMVRVLKPRMGGKALERMIALLRRTRQPNWHKPANFAARRLRTARPNSSRPRGKQHGLDSGRATRSSIARFTLPPASCNIRLRRVACCCAESFVKRCSASACIDARSSFQAVTWSLICARMSAMAMAPKHLPFRHGSLHGMSQKATSDE